MFYLKIYLCWRFLKVFLLYVEIHLYYFLCPLMRYKELSLINIHDIILVLSVILFLQIRISKGSRTTLWWRTKKSNISMDMLRNSEAGDSVLTLHDVSVYKVFCFCLSVCLYIQSFKRKKSFHIMLKVLYFNLCISSWKYFLNAIICFIIIKSHIQYSFSTFF